MLSEIEQLLIGYLNNSAARKGIQAAAYMTLQSDDQMLKMCHYLSENKDATEDEILDAAREIAADEQGTVPFNEYTKEDSLY